MATKTICRKCQTLISDHCTAEPMKVPDACVCYERRLWRGMQIPDICDRVYARAVLGKAFCGDCGHDVGCHVMGDEVAK